MTARRVIVVAFTTAALVVLGFVALGWIREQRLIARKSSLRNNFRQLQIGLENYHNANGKFPSIYSQQNADHSQQNTDPNARSWRVELLPYLSIGGILERYATGEPWNGPANERLAESLGWAPVIYRSPFTRVDSTPYSDFLAVGDQEVIRLRGEGREVHTVTIDGDSFHVVEIPNSRVHWMDPGDGL